MKLEINKEWIDEAVQKAVEELKQNNIWIPEGMTNGEVLQALFPNMKTEDTSVESLIGTDIDRGYVVFNRDWWNAPYQKGGE